MNVKIDFLPEFLRLAKPLWKKYPSFEQDYLLLLGELKSNPFILFNFSKVDIISLLFISYCFIV